jgi:helix-turn-helix protein
MSTDVETPWLTRVEAAAYARVRPSTIDRWSKAGWIPKHKVGGIQSTRYHKGEIDAFLRGGLPGEGGWPTSGLTNTITPSGQVKTYPVPQLPDPSAPMLTRAQCSECPWVDTREDLARLNTEMGNHESLTGHRGFETGTVTGPPLEVVDSDQTYQAGFDV